MNIVHILIITLLSIAQGALAQEVPLKDRIKDIQSLSDFELQRAYEQAADEYIKNIYNTKRAEFAAAKCRMRSADNKGACNDLTIQYDILLDDREAVRSNLNKISDEKRRRGISRIELEDLYRKEKRLDLKSTQELLNKKDRIYRKREEYENLTDDPDKQVYRRLYREMAGTRLLVIEQELKERGYYKR